MAKHGLCHAAAAFPADSATSAAALGRTAEVTDDDIIQIGHAVSNTAGSESLSAARLLNLFAKADWLADGNRRERLWAKRDGDRRNPLQISFH